MSVRVQAVGSEKPAEVQAAHGLPEEVRLELSKGNFVRAAHLASEKRVSREKVRELQSNALRQFIEQLHNFEAAKELVSSYSLSDDEVRTVLGKILGNTRGHTESIA